MSAPTLARRPVSRTLAAALLIAAALAGCKTPPPEAPEPDPVALDEAEPQPATPDPEDAPAGPETIRVATFNVALFFDTRCDSGDCGEGYWEQLPTVEQFEARANILARAIERLDADVVLLQEVETEESLLALQSRLADRYPVAVLGETGGTASIDVAVLSGGRKRRVVTHRFKRLPRPNGGGTTTFAREFLEVQLAFGDKEIVVFSAHFKSKNNDDPDRRLAEAQGALKIVLEAVEREPDALVVLGGDLNDVPGSAPLNALEDGGLLLRAASDVSLERAWTYNFRGQLNELDHLYMAVGTGSYVPDSANAFRDGDRGLGGSDHGAMTAEFKFP